MSGDWQCGKSLAECNQYMLDHEINTDVTFIIPDKDDEDNTGSDSVHCKAHRYMLVSRSPVFYAMLCGLMAEQGDIRVEDAKPEAFKKLLKYIYTDEIEISPTNVFDIMYLSKKYIIPRLTSKCIEYLHSILTPETACLILDHTWMYNDETLLEKKCLQEITLHTSIAFKSETMLDINNDTLLKILDCAPLAITEVEVFNACMRWANHQLKSKQVEATGENIRNVLGICIRKIAYADMGSGDFGSIVIPADILCTEEEVSIFRYMANKELHPLPPNFLCTRKKLRRFRVKFAHVIFTERISDLDVKVTMTSNKAIEITALYLGNCIGNTKITSVNFDQNPVNVTNKIKFDSKKEEYRLGSKLVLHKNQEHVLDFTFTNTEDDEEEPVYVHKTSKIDFVHENLKIKVQSNAPLMPLLGFIYNLVIPEGKAHVCVYTETEYTVQQ